MTILSSNILPWGKSVTDSGSSVSLTADQINQGVILKAGRNGTQTVPLPTVGLRDCASILIVAWDSNVSLTNTITVSGPTAPCVLTAFREIVTLVWLGEWVVV
jgi:hypothetical protein